MKGPGLQGLMRVRHVLKEAPHSLSIQYIEDLLTSKFQNYHAGLKEFQFISNLDEKTKIGTFYITAPAEHFKVCSWCKKSSLELVNRFWLACDVIAPRRTLSY